MKLSEIIGAFDHANGEGSTLPRQEIRFQARALEDASGFGIYQVGLGLYVLTGGEAGRYTLSVHENELPANHPLKSMPFGSNQGAVARIVRDNIHVPLETLKQIDEHELVDILKLCASKDRAARTHDYMMLRDGHMIFCFNIEPQSDMEPAGTRTLSGKLSALDDSLDAVKNSLLIDLRASPAIPCLTPAEALSDLRLALPFVDAWAKGDTVYGAEDDEIMSRILDMIPRSAAVIKGFRNSRENEGWIHSVSLIMHPLGWTLTAHDFNLSTLVDPLNVGASVIQIMETWERSFLSFSHGFRSKHDLSARTQRAILWTLRYAIPPVSWSASWMASDLDATQQAALSSAIKGREVITGRQPSIGGAYVVVESNNMGDIDRKLWDHIANVLVKPTREDDERKHSIAVLDFARREPSPNFALLRFKAAPAQAGKTEG